MSDLPEWLEKEMELELDMDMALLDERRIRESSNMVLNGNNLELLKTLEDNSTDSIVTDPPYGIKFMGKKWDHSVPSVEFWTECLRVLKPGGHVLSFGGTRTYHRMTVAIEDAGFEIRDQIMWLYGSGFPKSHNISKAIDKKLGLVKTEKGFNVAGQGIGLNPNKELRSDHPNYVKPSGKSDLAKKWDGFGTALKPANEPIVLARKPLSEKTIVDNVLKWGTGGLNIDDCRVETSDKVEAGRAGRKSTEGFCTPKATDKKEYAQGRFPANVILDEQAGEVLDEQSGISKSTGGASRFFYCAKASKKERGVDNVHPTVKPIKLMEYLIKLITPPNGTVLDPFMGSGSTGVAAKNSGFDFVGMELDPEYFEIANKRINKEI